MTVADLAHASREEVVAATRAHAVAIGGGHGLSRTLQALSRIAGHTTAVVTAADDGGSSGRLRRDLGDIIPPGDLRKAIAALSRRDELSRLLEYRFPRGELAGHSLGNLIMVALEDLNGRDVVAALDELCELLGVPGRVLPCTTTPLTLFARTHEREITGQKSVAQTPRVQRVWLEPADVSAPPDVVAAIARADLVVIGPGSLYTSIIPNLLVRDVAQAVIDAAVPVVFVANLREQPGETEGMTILDHLDALAAHVPALRIDVLVAHDGPPPAGPGRPLRVDPAEVAGHVGRVVAADLLDGDDGHDPARLGRVLTRLLAAARR